MFRTILSILLVFTQVTGAVERLPELRGTKMRIDNVQVDANTISTTNTNGNLVLSPNGTGMVIAPDLTLSGSLTAPSLILDGQASTPANPSAGNYKLYAKDDGKVYKLDSAGAESEIGSGGGSSGGINYISNPDAIVNTAGWSGYDDASATLVNGTGGTFDSTLTVTMATNEVIRNLSIESGSFKLAKSAANRQGEGICTELALDRIDIASSRTQVVSFDYQTTANYATGDLYVAVYAYADGPQVLSVRNDLSGNIASATTGTGVSGRFVGEFQTDNVNENFRVCFHIATTNATSWDFIFDNVKVSPAQTVPGAINTEWQSYAPTLSAGFGTTSNKSFYWRQNGEDLEVRGTFTVGTVAASLGTITLPGSATIGAVSLANTSTQPGPEVGSFTPNGFTNQWAKIVTATGTSTTLVFVAGNVGSNVALTPTNVNSVTSSTVTASVRFKVPISGWQASAALSTNMLESSGIRAQYSNGSSATYSSSAPLNFSTLVHDSHNSVTTGAAWKFTARRTAWYDITITNVANTAAGNGLVLYKNGISFAQLGAFSPTGGYGMNFSDSIKLNAGEYIDFRPTASLTIFPGIITIKEDFDHRIWSVYGDSYAVSSATQRERIERVYVAYNCTGSPCTMVSRSAGVSSVTRAGTGDYTINFVSGTFSAAPTCSITSVWSGGVSFGGTLATPSATAVRATTANVGGSLTDAGFSAICMGAR